MNDISSFRSVRLALALSAIFSLVSLHGHAATFDVTTATDTTSGAHDTGSLRDAIFLANTTASPPHTITFHIATGVQTITLGSALPTVTKPVAIDATTQPGYAGTPLIVIDANAQDFDGLTVNAFTNGVTQLTIKALCIINCGINGGTARHGLKLVDSNPLTVTGCYIGINAAGTAAARNTGAGIRCELPDTTIGGTGANDRCIISGNLGAGIDGQTDVSGQGSKITVLGSYIGVAADGVTAVPNGGDGIRRVTSSSLATLTIGNATVAGRNVISGNGGHGVRTQQDAKIKGNYIGVGADGTTMLGNTLTGISIEASSSEVGFGAGAGNVISSNGGSGVRVSSTSTNRSTIRDNFIGTDATGMIARGNGSHGVEITGGGATGGAALGANVISANTGSGVRVTSGDGDITTSKIGVTADGMAKLGNGGDGITLEGVPNRTLNGNTIGGNTGAGIHISGASATGLALTGNTIGGSASVNLGNGGNGITIDGGAQDEVIGATTAGGSAQNEITNNGGIGISFPVRTRILCNKIYANAGLPLDRGGDGADSPAAAPPEGGLAPRTSSDGKVNTATITQAKIDSQFPDRVNISYTFHQTSLAGVSLRVYFYGNLTGDPDMESPLGFADLTPDGNGTFTGTVQLPVFANGTTAFITSAVVTEISSSPTTSCSSECSNGFAIGGGGPPPPPTITNDTIGAHLFSTNDGDPVSTFTGEKFGLEAVDLNLRGPMPLLFARYYASKLASDANITSALGRNRLHNFDAKLTIADPNATVVLSDGRVVQFQKAGTKWTLVVRTDIAFQLVQSGTNYVLADPRSQRMWTFDATGVLQKIEDGRGNVHTLSYTGAQLTSVSDGLGRTLNFTYDGNNHLATVSDGIRTVMFGYTGSDLTTATDPLMHTTTFTYDANGHLLSTQLPRGNTALSQTYDANSRVATQTEHPATGDQVSTFAYNTTTHATTITDPTGKTRVHTNTATGELSTFTDEEGHVVATGSDATGRRSTVTDRLGHKTTIVYHALSGKPANITNADGTTTTLTYKPRVLGGITFYDLAKIAFADGTTRTFTYDAKGNVLSAVDQLGKKVSFTYDAHGQVLTITNATGGIATFTYDANENLATSKDSDTDATSYTFDGFNRLTKITHPDTTHVDIVYDDADRITSITDERSNAFAYTYDANDNVTIITDPAAKTTTLGYDALDRVTQITDRLGKVSTQAFDTRDLPASETDELNHTTTYARDTRQRAASVTDAGGKTTTFGYNDEAELTSVTDPLGHATTFARNRLGLFVAASDALGHTSGVERDVLQRITKIIDPTGRTNTLTYDKRGSFVGAVREGAGAASYARDAAGRLTKITDPNKGAWSFAYTPAGRLKSSTDPLGKTTGYAYDTRGRLVSLAFPDANTCTITRDAVGHVTELNYSGGPNLSYGYDSRGRLTVATDSSMGSGDNSVHFDYDDEGRLTSQAYPNGIATVSFTSTYDDAGRLTSSAGITYTYDERDRLTHVSDGANSVDLTYDDAGRLTSLTRSNGTTTTQTYDDANRLVRIQHANGGGSFIDAQYMLDAAGDVKQTNLTAPVLPTVSTSTQTFVFNAASEISTSGFSYDARGRLTAMPAIGSGTAHTFAWDGASRLRTVDSLGLSYDAFGSIFASGGTIYRSNYAIAGAPPVNIGARTFVWMPSGRLLWSTGPEGVRFYHFDRLGSTLVITDGSGSVADAYAYSPTGEVHAHMNAGNTQPFAFIGEYGVRSEGAYYQMRARYYDPVTARFLSRDPGAPDLTDVRTLDPYLYALGNPARYIDATGAAPEDAGGDVALGLFFGKFLLGIPLPGETTYEQDTHPDDYEFRPFYGIVKIPEVETRVEQPILPRSEVFSGGGGAKPALAFVADALATTSGGPSTIDVKGLALRTQAMVGLLGMGTRSNDPFAGAGYVFFEEGLRDVLHHEVDVMLAEEAKSAAEAPKLPAAEVFTPGAPSQAPAQNVVSGGKKKKGKGIGPLNALKQFIKANKSHSTKATQFEFYAKEFDKQFPK